MKFLVFVCFLVAIRSATFAVEDYDPTNENLGAASYFNKSTSSFVKIIKTEDIRDHDVIYANSAVLFIGKEDGEVLRCLQEDPDECEVFYKAGSRIHTMLITGEHLFLGTYSSLILRCDLYSKDSCKTFYSASSELLALSVDGGYLYASQYNSPVILRCDLNQSNNCRLLHTMEKSYMWAFSHFGKYIYAGQENGQIVRCSVRADSTSCKVVYEMNSSIQAFTNMADNMYAVTSNNNLWNCSLKADSTIDCVSVSININSPTDIESFSNQLYVVNSEGVYICKWSNNTSCWLHAHRKKARKVAIAYETYQLQSRYQNEQTACTWQSNYKCPPFVIYYGPHERYMLEVHVKRGRLYNSQGFLVDTRNAEKGNSGLAAIFAMGPDGRILLSNVHLKQLIHTSSLFAGNPVAGAGEIVVINGVIMNITTCSDHYRPDLKLNHQVIQSLQLQGYTDQIHLQSCSKDIELDQTESNNDQ